MNLPTLLVLALVAAALFLVVRYYVKSGRKITDCGCGSGCACKGCPGSRDCPVSSKAKE